MPSPLVAATSVVFQEILYVSGGFCNGKQSNQLLSYNGLFWEKKASMKQGRMGASAEVFDGKVLVCGGSDRVGTLLKSCEVYDSETNHWSPFPSLKYARRFFSMVVMNGTLMVLGGHGRKACSSVEQFDPQINRWIVRPEYIPPRWNSAVVTW